MFKGKRDLVSRQKRPILKAKETYYKGKRDLFSFKVERMVWRQKRPSIKAKET